MASLLTGGNGFVGRYLVESLVALLPDEPLYCLVRDMAASQWMDAHPNITRIQGDLLKPETYQSIIPEITLVYHLAAKLGLRNGSEFYEQNAFGTQCLLRAFKDSLLLERFFFLSSIAAVDRSPDVPAAGPLTASSLPCPASDYGKSKLQAEMAVRESGLPYTILRPAYIYGSRTRKGSSVDNFLRDILSRKPYTTIPFPGRVSTIEVRELVKAICQAAQSQNTLNQTYFVADPAPLGVSKVIQLAADTFNVPLEPRVVSMPTMARLQRYCYAKAANPVIARILFEDAFYCDSTSLWQALGYQPSVRQEHSLKEALLSYLDTFGALGH